MSKYENWFLEENGHIATICLDKPESSNSLDSETLLELRDICLSLRSRDEVWAVLLRSAGGHFSTGFDLSIIQQSLDESEVAVGRLLASHHLCLTSLEQLEKPTIALIRGFCIGGGLILALCCDFRLASRKTIFSLPEVRLGIPVLWGTHRIVRLIGPARAKKPIMTGGRIKAEEALEMGLVHQVVGDESLESSADTFLTQLLSAPPRTLGITKRIIDRSINSDAAGSEQLEIEAIGELLGHPDLHEAIKSYREKRAPHYKG